VRSWASDTLLGPRRRDVLLRAALAVLLVAGLFWALPVRRAGEEGGHHDAHVGGDARPGGHPGDAAHAPHPAPLDLFERAGVSELAAGQRGPAFRLGLLAGGEASLETWTDRLVVLNFWATWCTPCTLEMPTLEALWRAYRDRGLIVAGISVDRGAPRALLEPYVQNLDLTFPILLDADGAVAGAWRVTALPATFVIRPGGEVAGMAVGPREWHSAEMRALLETMLPAAGRARR
jgi:peroxiredoxin